MKLTQNQGSKLHYISVSSKLSSIKKAFNVDYALCHFVDLIICPAVFLISDSLTIISLAQAR